MTADDAKRVTEIVGWGGPIEVGDVVYLCSGSPGMTVVAVVEEGFECVWFDKAKPRRMVFPQTSLTKQPTSADGKKVGVLVIGSLGPDDKAN
jgi:uncharacterized protein YodC (DUF2158 family)